MGTNLMLFQGVKYDKEFGNNGELIVFQNISMLKIKLCVHKSKNPGIPKSYWIKSLGDGLFFFLHFIISTADNSDA